ncbi:MAG TPA: hypothetical protein PK988_12575, partial [Candidatus Sumerlaeota bacterium]|nr:hypothetical protein [Candidatus Sumerlaeota bacterium]
LKMSKGTSLQKVVLMPVCYKMQLQTDGTTSYSFIDLDLPDAASFGPGELQEFKRVNAIDQVGNEGRPVVPTNTVVFDAKWENVVLIRNGQRLPFNGQRFTDMRCPTPSKVAVTAVQNDESGEMITIDGSK